MTALNLSTDIPSAINTVERLHAWSGYLLATVNPQLAILEDVNRTEFVASEGIIKAADGSIRVITRAALDLDPNYRYDSSKKLWMHVREFSSTAIPAGFKTN
jgi:hypothetical protein